jgi:hypothetical protein
VELVHAQHARFETTAINNARLEVTLFFGQSTAEFFFRALDNIISHAAGENFALVRADPETGTGPHFLVPTGLPDSMHYDGISKTLVSVVMQLLPDGTPTAFWPEKHDITTNLQPIKSTTAGAPPVFEPSTLGDAFIRITQLLTRAEEANHPPSEVPDFTAVLFNSATSAHAAQLNTPGTPRLVLYAQAKPASTSSDRIPTSEFPLSQRTMPVEEIRTLNIEKCLKDDSFRMKLGAFLLGLQKCPEYREVTLPDFVTFEGRTCYPIWAWDDDIARRAPSKRSHDEDE